MSLRARLTLFFVAIVVLPVTALSAFGWRAAARVGERQVRSELELARRSAMVAFSAQAERARDAVAALSRDPTLTRALAAVDADAVQDLLDRHAATSLLVAVTAPDGRVLGRAGRTRPSFLPGVRRPPLRRLLEPEPKLGKRSWPVLQRVAADLRRRGCRPTDSRACRLVTVTAGVWPRSSAGPPTASPSAATATAGGCG